MGARDLTVTEIVTRLTERTEELAQVLLPAGVKNGHEWRAGSVNGEPGQSLGVHLYGAKRGLWADFNSADDKGDMLDLIAAVNQFSKGAAVNWAKNWLGLDGKTPVRPLRPNRKRSPASGSPELDDAKKTEWVQRIWAGAEPAAGTLAENYLRSRGIEIPIPPSIRFAFCRHKPTGLDLPCMVAGVQNEAGELTAVHRTFLRLDVRGKANVTTPKMMLGRVRGGAVRLALEGRRLGLVEGVENGLSVAQLYPDTPVWSVLSVTFFGLINLPPIVEEVVLYLDGDAPDSQAGRAAAKAAVTLMNTGRQVRIARASEGTDFNDALRASIEPPVIGEGPHV